VDGQQRFTTITMILCAIRNALESEGYKDLAKGVHSLVERKDISNKNQYIIQTETSYPYLQEKIQNFKTSISTSNRGTEEESSLKIAFEYFCTNIKSIIDEIKNDKNISSKKIQSTISKKLIDIRDRILKLKLIFVELEDEDEAYLIFEILNARGKDLRVSDLFKSYITNLIKPTNHNVDLIKDKWHKMVELIEQTQGELSFDSFLHHFWLSKYDYVTAKKLYKKLKGIINKHNACDFVEQLEKNANIYREIHETAFRKWQKTEQNIKRSLDALQLFRVKQDLPMIVSVMRAYEAKKLKLKHVEDILRTIENFHFIFTAITSQRSSGGISFMYALSARELENASTESARIKVLGDLKTKLRLKLPSQQEFDAIFINIKYSRNYSKQKAIVQYILEKVDRFSRQKGASLNYDEMTIEHITPENSRSSSPPLENVAEIGNLILVDKDLNNKLGNKSFTDKKRLLSGSALYIDKGIGNAKTWGTKEIAHRSKSLSKIAYTKVWKY
jgi:hypothetical protein